MSIGVQPTPPPIRFSRNLAEGMDGVDVKILQKILNADPATRIASSGVGSPGKESNHFGSLTKKAVQKFQTKYGIASAGSQGFGLVGPLTRKKLEEVSARLIL
jgi:peptidoglycan hydrolase-like protein with peptidoglycan-binding domain